MFVGALAFSLSFSPLARPLGKDPATWDLMATFLPHGLVPYRDIFLHKTPGAALLGSVGASIAELTGRTPVLGAHLVFLMIAAAAPALLFALCRTRMTAAAALAAAAFMLAFDQWLLPSIEGVRPKVGTMTFGLASLLAAARGRAFLAGALGSMATICWQPGVAFLGGAAWELVARRDAAGPLRVLARAAVGAAVPAVALLIGFAAAGGLGDLFEQAVLFNRQYVEVHAKQPLATLRRLLWLMRQWSPVETALLAVASVGLVLPLGARTGISAPPSLVVAGFAYVGLTFVSLQGWPDTILLAAPAAGLISAGLVRLTRLVPRARHADWLVLLVALACMVTPHRHELTPPVTFAEQAEFMTELAGDLGPHDRVLVIGVPEFSIHTGRLSVWPWPYMWFGVDRFAAGKSPGGFAGMLARLDRDRPRLILVARTWGGPLRTMFECWTKPRYRHRRVSYWPHLGSRPIHVYRLREKVDERAARRYQKLPDLEVRAAAGQGRRLLPGETLRMKVEVRNAGCGRAVPPPPRFLLSTDATPSASDLELEITDGVATSTSRLGKGASTTVAVALAVPDVKDMPERLARRVADGKYVYVIAVVGGAGELDELDETNNVRAIRMRTVRP